ncbi:MAG: tetratricopeptide repeat protein [Gemmatimonadaceae bacterium]
MNRQALAALDGARPAIARLDRSRHAEELAADLIEAWSGVETALRSLIGGTPLGGQQLIREARQRQLITFDQANALAEFQAARERSQDTSYHPTDADISAAREGFLKLEASLMSTPATERGGATPGEAMSTKGLRLSPLGTPQPVPMPSERKPWVIPVVALVVVAALGLAAWMLFGQRGDPSLDRGVAYWQGGQRELAVAEFSRAARDNPKSALPHVYLSRMAREVGNMTLAGQEATLAVQAEPNNAIAQREMASYLLAAGNYELARRFYVRALQLSPEDRMAQGFLGCALIKLGRFDEGMRWMNRAGQGSWSSCAPAGGLGAPGTMPPALPR